MRKVTLATSVAGMAVGLIAAFSVETKALATGGGEKGPFRTVECGGIGTSYYAVCDGFNNASCTPRGCS